MPTTFTTLNGCRKNAVERRTIFALSEIMLFQLSLIPTPSTPLADFELAEATYDGYARKVITAWNAPGLGPGTGWLIQSPSVQFDYGPVVGAIGNVIGGAVLIDAAGEDRLCVIFDEPIAMQGLGNIVPLSLVDLFPTGY